jgi:hypothetical protein
LGARFLVRLWRLGKLGSAAPMRQAPGAARLIGEEVFDLGVDAAKVVRGPLADRLKEARINPEQKALGVWHLERGSGVERAGVDNWSRRVVSRKHDHQVCDHRRLALGIELD